MACRRAAPVRLPLTRGFGARLFSTMRTAELSLVARARGTTTASVHPWVCALPPNGVKRRVIVADERTANHLPLRETAPPQGRRFSSLVATPLRPASRTTKGRRNRPFA
jgi:hypothetical protein